VLKREDKNLLDTESADSSFDSSDNKMAEIKEDHTQSLGLFRDFFRGDSLEDISELQEYLLNEINNALGDFWKNKRHLLNDFSNFSQPIGKWPKIDIEEDDKNYYIIVAAPGFTKDEIEIELVNTHSGCALSIAVAKKEKKENKKRHYSEIRYSRGKRIIPIAGSFVEEVMIQNISAKENEDGTFSITLPKNKEVKKTPEVHKILID